MEILVIKDKEIEPEISYSITNGSLTTNGEEVILSLLGKMNQ